MEAEYYALVEGLRVASVESEHREHCVVYSDCQPLLDKMRGENDNSGHWYDYYHGCRWLLDKFEDWDLRYCPRERNGDAHEMAHRALDGWEKS